MEYTIKHIDTPLVRFSANRDTADSEYEVLWVNENARQLLPFGMDASAQGVESWIRHRTIPKNRAFASTFLARNGLNANKALGILALSRGLSLTDCYWIEEIGCETSFAKINLYDNPISRLLAQVAFTGSGSYKQSEFASSPEFTTNGMLPKCWRRINGNIYLYKGGTTGAANAGFEPYSEYYAADAAKAFGVDAIDYGIHKWKGRLCSSCELFTSKEQSFVPVANIVKSGGFNAVVEFYESSDIELMQPLSEMLAFDALICNTDRHLNNFGFLADNKTNELIGAAPLFDHGNSLFYQAYGDDWSSNDALGAYASAQDACLYGDFFDGARRIMTRKTKSMVRGMLEFEFSRKPIKGFPKKRLSMIEEQIRLRARKLLE